MRPELHGVSISSKRARALDVLALFQLIVLVFIYQNARTPTLWGLSILSFLLAAIVCIFEPRNGRTLFSLVVLFITQQSIFISANPSWGFSFGSDQINDFHVASLMSERTHFELGKLTYATRYSYSDYPMLHLLSAILSTVSNVPLTLVAMYFVPILSASLAAFCLFYLNHDLFGLQGRERNLATMLFEMSFYYTSFGSQFVRETLAFPFVLMSLLAIARLTKRQSQGYNVVALVLVGATVLTHHISSYLLLAILIVMALSLYAFRHSKRLFLFVFLAAIEITAYISFVAPSLFASQVQNTLSGLQTIFNRGGSASVMRAYSASISYLSYAHYALLIMLVMLGGLKLLRGKNKDWYVLALLALFTCGFFLCVLLRLSTSADAWSWTYYMSLRGTTWAFLGISVVAAVGLCSVSRLGNGAWRNILVFLLIICVLAAGKFSQDYRIVTDPSMASITYPRYVAAEWLKGETVHGSGILVPPYTQDYDAFEVSRSMAPYAYLSEYFLNEKEGYTYDKFIGYIPFVGTFFDQYTNSTHAQIVYDNGEVKIGSKQQ